jgi:tetratricopeptide (TPR) repeat protein
LSLEPSAHCKLLTVDCRLMACKNMVLASFMRKYIYLIVLLCLTGCTHAGSIGMQAVQVGKSIQYRVLGEHYLQTGNVEQGEATFRRAVQETPDSAESNYYLGRFLLAGGKHEEAVSYLEKAVALDPGKADYFFWLGVAYGEIGWKEEEMRLYSRALEVDPRHLQALIYQGHSRLNNKQYEEALDSYRKALEIWPESPAALYNRALILKNLGRSPEERIAWKEYLDLYPAGALARRAADHLNQLSDFSYRNHTLGARTITLAGIRFMPFTAELESSSHPSLRLAGAAAANMGKGTLQIVVYQKNNKELARERAISIKKYLEDQFPGLREGRIGISWFAVPEEFTVAGTKLQADESVRFFLTE